MTVENEGELDEQPNADAAMAFQLGALAQRGESEMTTAQIRSGVGRDSEDGTVKRALKPACDRDYICESKRGVYCAGSQEVLDV
jgi:hypothetical protein